MTLCGCAPSYPPCALNSLSSSPPPPPPPSPVPPPLLLSARSWTRAGTTDATTEYHRLQERKNLRHKCQRRACVRDGGLSEDCDGRRSLRLALELWCRGKLGCFSGGRWCVGIGELRGEKRGGSARCDGAMCFFSPKLLYLHPSQQISYIIFYWMENNESGKPVHLRNVSFGFKAHFYTKLLIRN